MYHIHRYKELTQKSDALYTAGGSAMNTLRVAQWILDRPKICVFFGCVGTDDFSKILEQRALKDGVNVRYQHNDIEPTGTCGVLVTGIKRSLCAHLAAANQFTIDHIHLPENKKLIDNAHYFYITVYKQLNTKRMIH